MTGPTPGGWGVRQGPQYSPIITRTQAWTHRNIYTSTTGGLWLQNNDNDRQYAAVVPNPGPKFRILATVSPCWSIPVHHLSALGVGGVRTLRASSLYIFALSIREPRPTHPPPPGPPPPNPPPADPRLPVCSYRWVMTLVRAAASRGVTVIRHLSRQA